MKPSPDLPLRSLALQVLLERNQHLKDRSPAVDLPVLTLALSFLLTSLFYERNLKEPPWPFLARFALADRLLGDLLGTLGLFTGPSG